MAGAIWVNADLWLNEPLGTNFSEIAKNSYSFIKKIHLKLSSENWRPFVLKLYVLNHTE